MAKAKPIPRGKAGKRPKRRRGGRLFLRVILWRPVQLLLLLAACLGVLFWQSEAVMGFFSGLWGNTLSLFGLGSIIIVAWLLTLVWALWRRRDLFRYWGWWLGAIAISIAVFGILSFFTTSGGVMREVSIGGRFGRAIGGGGVALGSLKITALFLAGITLIAPGALWRFLSGAASGIKNLYQRYPLHVGLWLRNLAKKQPGTVAEEAIERPEREAKPQVIAKGAEDVKAKLIGPSQTQTSGIWRMPPLDLMESAVEVEFTQSDNDRRARLIEEALASYGVEAKVVQINAGPTVTQFGVEPGWDRKYREVKERDRDGNLRVHLDEVSKTRVKVERITSLTNDLALSLAVPSIRIEAPVPGKSMVGIEVPNVNTWLVSLRSVIETPTFQRLGSKTRLPLALGKGVGGEAVVADLQSMPHLLIAGATGSGKTVCLNSIISCLLIHDSPEHLKLILIDPKRVELVPFNPVPHLISPVIVEKEKALGALRWLNQEMDSRYKRLESAGAKNIESYNRSQDGPIPYIILIIDELADLMMWSSDEVERLICRLAQLARATGIHIIIATQRPSVDVVTGLIKANFPARIAFAVPSQFDSRTILDTGGAEKLLGGGDMLYMPPDVSRPMRLQGCFVSEDEIERLTNFWGNQGLEQRLREEVAREITQQVVSPEDPLLERARQLAKEHKHLSTSFLQRKLSIGYPRAAKLMDLLEGEGLVSSGEPGRSREVIKEVSEDGTQ